MIKINIYILIIKFDFKNQYIQYIIQAFTFQLEIYVTLLK